MAETPALTDFLPRLGLKHFRPGQEEVIDSVIAGEDVMCVMPTGGGKSLCYQLPSLVRPGLTIVISPLIALMKDQVDTLKRLGIRAELINSSLTTAEQSDAMQKMRSNELDLIYVAPERLRNGRFIETVNQCTVNLLAVDEAHCVSEWGHDFRPDYARLGHFRNRHLNQVQTIALTATATPTVRSDISNLLNLRDPKVFVTGFSRDNLRFMVRHCNSEKEKNDSLINYLSDQSGSGIIYAATRKRCEELAESIGQATDKKLGIYHAGLDPVTRQQTQERFMGGDLSAIVATNAFGMGIDKSDIRFVVHYNMPGSLEAYYQEAGRAGRDGHTSQCLLLFSYSDRYIQEFFIENRYPTKNTVQQVYDFLRSRDEDPIELTLEEVRELIGTRDSNEAISTAEQLLAKTGILKRLESTSNQAVLRIDSDIPTLLDLVPIDAKIRRKVLEAAESIVGIRRGEDVYTTPSWFAKKANVERAQLNRALKELCKLSVFDYVPPFRGRGIHFTDRTRSFDQLNIDFEQLNIRKSAEYEKLESVIRFARNAYCRQQLILEYFGEENPKHCGKCDRCQPDTEKHGSRGDQIQQSFSSEDDRYLLRGLQIVMSGVTRMHGRFGKNMVAQMLCGSKNKKLTQWRLHQLSTYGLLSSMKQSEITLIMDRLSEFGLILQQEIEQRRPTIHMTELGKEVMHGRNSLPAGFSLASELASSLVAATRDIEPLEGDEGREGQASTPKRKLQTAEDERVHDELADSLKRWRRKTSAALGLPAFRVLTNATLERITTNHPLTLQDLGRVKGVGDSTLEQFGEDILKTIVTAKAKTERNKLSPVSEKTVDDRKEDHHFSCDEESKTSRDLVNPSQKLETRFSGKDKKLNASEAGTDSWFESDAYWSWRLIEAGFTPKEVVKIRNCTQAELTNHLELAKKQRLPAE